MNRVVAATSRSQKNHTREALNEGSPSSRWVRWVENVEGRSAEQINEQWKRTHDVLDQLRKSNVSQSQIAKDLDLDPARLSEYRGQNGMPATNRPVMCAIFGYLRQGGFVRNTPGLFHLQRPSGKAIDPDYAVYHEHHFRCLTGVDQIVCLDSKLDELEILLGITLNAPQRYKTRMIQNFLVPLLDLIDVDLELAADQRERVEALTGYAPYLAAEAERNAQPDDLDLALPMSLVSSSCILTHRGIVFGKYDDVSNGVSAMIRAIQLPCRDRVKYMRNVWATYNRMAARGGALQGHTTDLSRQMSAIRDLAVLEDLAKATNDRHYETAGDHLKAAQPSLWQKLKSIGATLAILVVLFSYFSGAAIAQTQSTTKGNRAKRHAAPTQTLLGSIGSDIDTAIVRTPFANSEEIGDQGMATAFARTAWRRFPVYGEGSGT